MKELEKTKLQLAQQESDDLIAVMSTAQGRRLVARWLDKTGLYRLSFDGSSRTFFMEGQRAVGLGILDELMQHCPELRLLMEAEAHSAQQAAAQKLEHAASRDEELTDD